MTTPHLDDDALSAAVDGVATAAEQAHLAGCGHCRQQLASLAAVARAVGAALTPRSAQEVDDAVERALAAWSPATDGDRAPVSGGGSVPPSEAALAFGGDRGAVPPISRDLAPPPRRRRGVRPGWIGAVAAVAAAFVVVAGLAAALRGKTHSASTTALAPAAAPSLDPSTTAAVANQLPGTTLRNDLGDQSDPATLARLVAGAVSSPPAAAGVAASPPPGQGSGAASGALLCVSRAQTAAGLGTVPEAPVTFTASLRWRGQPAAVVVFSRPTGGLAGVVMKTADCSLLAVLPF